MATTTYFQAVWQLAILLLVIQISSSHGRALEARSLENQIPLRMLPLGDSITWGYLSSDGNGYRLDLLNQLSGNPVQYIGSQRSGNMTDNYNEGWPGYEIAQIAQKAELSLPERPNVILLMAGTNDINNNFNVSTAPERLGSLMDECIAACPDAVLIVAQITPIANEDAEARAQTFNAAIPGLVSSRASAGHKVLTVNMQNSQDGLTAADLKDGLHPTDEGYAMMANIWYQGLQQAASNNWITAPVSGAPIPGQACNGTLFWYNNYGTIFGGGSDYQQDYEVLFADIDGDGRDDYVMIEPNGALSVYRNLGANSNAADGWDWISLGTIASGVGSQEQIRMADINGDGKADYLIIDDSSGAVAAYLNGGPDSSANDGWLWISVGTIASGVGPGANIRFADINGDGKSDYLLVGDDGSVTAYLNGGQDSSANDGWVFYPQGQIASGVGATIDEVRFADINGDALADYLVLNQTSGAVQMWRNGGPSSNANGGWVWYPEGQIASGVGASGADIRFGNIVGSGRADYAVLTPSSGATYLWANGCSQN